MHAVHEPRAQLANLGSNLYIPTKRQSCQEDKVVSCVPFCCTVYLRFLALSQWVQSVLAPSWKQKPNTQVQRKVTI